MSYAGVAQISYFEPGVEGLLQTDEGAVFYGTSSYWNVFKLNQALIDGASRDAGNTGKTTILRVGLIMAYNTTTNKWTPWVSGGMNGTGKVSGILFASIDTQFNGADKDRYVGAISVGGLWKSEGLILPGETSRGITGATAAAFRTAMGTDMPWVRLSDHHQV